MKKYWECTGILQSAVPITALNEKSGCGLTARQKSKRLAKGDDLGTQGGGTQDDPKVYLSPLARLATIPDISQP